MAAVTSSLLAATALGIAGFGMGRLMTRGSRQQAHPMPMPEPPQPKEIETEAKQREMARRRMRQRSRTIFTSPLGVAGEANVARKTLLGQ